MIATLLICIVAVPAYDGDGLKCHDGARLRLANIDAPEIHCPRNRPLCTTKGAIASRDNLRRFAPVGSRVSYVIQDADRCRAGRQPTDHYGRLIVRAYVNSVDLSQAQLQAGMAVPYRWRCR